MKLVVNNSKTLYILFIITVFSIPLKLSFTYVTLFPLILLWIYNFYQDKGYSRLNSLLVNELYQPLIYFLGYCLISGLFGLDPYRSILGTLRLSFFSIFILVVADISSRKSVLLPIKALTLGSSIAATYIIIKSIILYFEPNTRVPKLFIGAVTQSGQLAIITIFAFGSLIYCYTKYKNGLLAKKRDLFLALISFALIVSNLVINLKRGPWAGVFFALVILSLFYNPKFFILIFVFTILTTFCFESVYNRLSDSVQDFLISGGRSDIWDIGIELITKYPFGIGYDNSNYLRLFSDKIPPDLQHFHSNILNILVETGWFGLLFFFWWIYKLFKLSFFNSSSSEDHTSLNKVISEEKVNKEDRITCKPKNLRFIFPVIGASILSWQVAGLVEYNFGDSEIVILVFFVIGLLIGQLNNRDKKESQTCMS